MNNTAYRKKNKVEFINGGADYFKTLIDLINQAKASIYLQVYIFENDQTGKLVIESLINASKRNVSIFLLVDGIASNKLSNHYINKLKKAGISFYKFDPIFNRKHFYPGRRMHQKVIVIDEAYAIVGGINIADKYNDTQHGKAWLDFAVLVMGEIVTDLVNSCKILWKETNANYEDNGSKNIFLPINHQFNEFCEVRIRTNDWLKHNNQVSNSYIELFHSAQNKITILCSYFIPGRVFRRLIKNASNRGVDITVITTGISDVLIAKYAERWLYDWLLRHRVKIYEYQSNILHGKLAICDSKWLTIGSYNINDISAYASIELNLDIKNDNFVASTLKRINTIIEKECIEITSEIHYKRKHIINQLMRWLSYQCIRTIFLMCTFYFKRKE